MIDERELTIDEVLHIDTKEPVNITVNDEDEEMTLYTAARWLALIQSLETINTRAEQLKINLDKDTSWVKPLALQKFIDEQTPSCVAQIKTLKVSEE